MSLVLSICVLFILLMQSVNGGQFLNIHFFPLYCESPGVPVAAVFTFGIIPLKRMYASQ